MDEFDYQRVCRIIRYVLKQPHLTEEDRDDIRQEAALAAHRYGFDPSTRIYYAALDAAAAIRAKRITVPIKSDRASEECLETEVCRRDLLHRLTPRQRFAIEGTLWGYRQAELGRLLHLNESQINRDRKLGLRRLRNWVK